MFRRTLGVVLIVVGVGWIAVLVPLELTRPTSYLRYPYSRYVTAVTLEEDRGSGCGRGATIWAARDVDGELIEICDERFSGGEVGDVLPVGEPTLVSRLTTHAVIIMILSLPGLLLAVWGFRLRTPEGFHTPETAGRLATTPTADPIDEQPSWADGVENLTRLDLGNSLLRRHAKELIVTFALAVPLILTMVTDTVVEGVAGLGSLAALVGVVWVRSCRRTTLQGTTLSVRGIWTTSNDLLAARKLAIRPFRRNGVGTVFLRIFPRRRWWFHSLVLAYGDHTGARLLDLNAYRALRAAIEHAGADGADDVRMVLDNQITHMKAGGPADASPLAHLTSSLLARATAYRLQHRR